MVTDCYRYAIFEIFRVVVEKNLQIITVIWELLLYLQYNNTYMNIIYKGKKGEGVRDLIEYRYSKVYKKLSKDVLFMSYLDVVIRYIESAENINELFEYSTLHFERLKGRNGECSIRIKNGRVERLIVAETENGLEIIVIEIDENHYGRKK